MSTEPRRRLGKYELQERLGHGGMAEVWKALDTQLQRYVAIKLLHANLQADPEFVKRFQHEAQAIASLRHPNIVQIHVFPGIPSSQSDSPTAYMVMASSRGRRWPTTSPTPPPGEESRRRRDRQSLYLYQPCRRLCSSERDDLPRYQTRQYLAGSA